MIDDVSNDGPTEQELEALWRVLMRAALRTGEGDVCRSASAGPHVCGAPLLDRKSMSFVRLSRGTVYGVFRCGRCRGRLGVFSDMR